MRPTLSMHRLQKQIRGTMIKNAAFDMHESISRLNLILDSNVDNNTELVMNELVSVRY